MENIDTSDEENMNSGDVPMSLPGDYGSGVELAIDIRISQDLELAADGED